MQKRIFRNAKPVKGYHISRSRCTRKSFVYWGDVTNFKGNQACIDFYWEHRRQRGVFDNHFFSSIPYDISYPNS